MFELRPNPSVNDNVEASMSIQTSFLKHCYMYRKSWSAGVAQSLIANRYGLGLSRIESRCGRDFTNTSRPTLRSTHSPVQWVPGLFSWGKTAVAWCWPEPPSSSVEVIDLSYTPNPTLGLHDLLYLCIYPKSCFNAATLYMTQSGNLMCSVWVSE